MCTEFRLDGDTYPRDRRCLGIPETSRTILSYNASNVDSMDTYRLTRGVRPEEKNANDVRRQDISKPDAGALPWKEETVEPKKIRLVERAADQSVQESNAVEADKPSASTPPKTYYAFYAGNESNTVTCEIGGVEHPMLVDSGAEANLITDVAWEKLKAAGIEVTSCVKGSDRVLRSYANNIPLTVLGTFKATVRIGARSAEAEFFVIRGG